MLLLTQIKTLLSKLKTGILGGVVMQPQKLPPQEEKNDDKPAA
jgi:hypothetical protein